LAKQAKKRQIIPAYMQPFLGFKTDKKKNISKTTPSEKQTPV
jgi:hypothetical protein